MPDEDFTSIGVKPSTKERLADLKVHPNQSFDEVINQLIEEKNAKKR